MSAIHEAAAILRSMRADLAAYRSGPDLVDALDSAIELLSAIRPVCLHCGAENHRRGDFCQDKCRTAYGREHAPPGRVRSIRPLARGRVSVTVHFEKESAMGSMRSLGFFPGGTVHVLPEHAQEEPNP